MIQVKITCSRCGKTWDESLEEHREKIPKYSITEYVPKPLRTTGRYKRIDFCPECERAFEKFLGGKEVTEAVSDEWFVIVKENGENPQLTKISPGCIREIESGSRVVTLKSYLETHK